MKKIAIFFLAACFATIVWGDVSSSEEIVAPSVAEAVKRGAHPLVVVALQKPPASLKSRTSINEAVKALQEGVLLSLDKADYTLVHRYESVSGLAIILHSESALNKLADHPWVRRIDLDAGGSATLNQSRSWIQADVAHNIGLYGAGQTVAVLDSGIDTDHPDLQDDVVREHCLCNTGVDCCPTGGNIGDGPGSAEDDHGHGTHVSGIITSAGAVAPLGIAPDAGIIAVKVLASDGSFCCSSDITAALDWVLNNAPEVAVINLSLGTFARFSEDCDTATAWTMVMADAVNALRSAGVLSIAATGNEDDKYAVRVPACLSGAVAVGATADDADSVVSFSNSSPSLDLLAPGSSITSTILGGETATWDGTSMAAPHVAALSALIQENTPSVSAEDVFDCLSTSPVNLTDTNGITKPRIDALSALDACVDLCCNCSEEAKLWIHKAYIGYYARCADYDGFYYWCGRLDDQGGGSDLSSIIAAFGTSQEYTDRFDALSDSELINNLYLNMFDRDAETGGLEFYLELLESHRQYWRDTHDGSNDGATEYALSLIALDVLNGAQGNDLTTLNAKISACPQY